MQSGQRGMYIFRSGNQKIFTLYNQT